MTELSARTETSNRDGSLDYFGVFPVLPTVFDDQGGLDLEGQDRVVDFVIDAGVDGVCILANWSEQFSLTDRERDVLIDRVLGRVEERVPVIVTTSHFSTHVAKERSAYAERAGAAMIMLMPPYHGASLRPGEQEILDHFRAVAEPISIPVMIQDSPLSGVELSVPLLAQLATTIPNVRYAKIEVSDTATKLLELTSSTDGALPGLFDGEEGITLLADLEAGAQGTMPSATIPELLRQIVDAFRAGQTEKARELYERVLPILLYENRHTGLATAKALMKAGGIIESDAVRHPLRSVSEHAKERVIEYARRLDALVLSWARS